MKMLNNGMQCEILKVFKNASNNTKIVNEQILFTDLIRVKLSSGKIVLICETELEK
jgi:hypothetical protein